ncbi:MAG: hypothetical protein HY822_17105 [Acidobacteria bacterium]|nr:hypothetical protein [Acidobacteriota bacterium]
MRNPTLSGGRCSATLAVYKRVNSVISMLLSTVNSCHGYGATGELTLRAIRRASGAIYVLDEWDNYLVWLSDSDLQSG